MDSDDDFLPPSQFGRSQPRTNATIRSAVTSSSANRSQTGNWLSQANRGSSLANPGSSQLPQSQTVITSSTNRTQSGSRQAGPGTSQSQPGLISPEEKLSQIQDGLVFLMNQVKELTGNGNMKRPEQKPLEKKPNTKEQCQICKKLYANKTTLFRHYHAIHKEMNPEKYHGFSLNSTIVNLDTSIKNDVCSICGYVANSQSSLDEHHRTIHNVANVNQNNKENVNVKNKMYKCEDCVCYFEEKSKFDEHMKDRHGFEVVCKICNKNLLFKDFDGHVKDRHPEVYNNNKHKEKEKYVVEKIMKTKKGKRVHVFTCTKCDLKMYDKVEAYKHARAHKKGLKIRASGKRVTAPIEISRDATASNSNVIFTCNNCNASTDSYDVVVEHSQNHLTNNSYGEECVTQTCSICEIKFEPICFKKHMDLHYKNKEIHKESFKYNTYNFQLLLTGNWFESFDMTDTTIKDMIRESIYAHTRSVKMRIMEEGVHKLYKCCQCDNFVEPAAVTNHTINYDTCLKVKSSYACDNCKRKFNNRLTRDKHAKDHNDASFKIVIFNNERDKEFNKVLNDPNARFSDPMEIDGNDNNGHCKVLYKCLCGLCFVRKETADVHMKICPGKDPKKPCPKCNNMFNSDELLVHCFEHHLNESELKIENITPAVIVIDSDEDTEDRDDTNENRGDNLIENKDDNVIEIDSSDEDDARNESFDNIKIEVLSGAITVRGLVEHDTERRDLNDRETIEIVNDTIQTQINAFHTENNAEVEERRNNDKSPQIFEIDQLDIMTDEDSEDTISYENIETPAVNPKPAVTTRIDEIKCVPTNLLLNPFHFDSEFLNRDLKKEATADFESVRQDDEMLTESLNSELMDVTVKEENPWLYDPTDFSNICRRPSLRQIPLASSTISQEMIIESLLTDDEEEMLPDNVNETIVNNITSEKNPNDNGSNNVATVSVQQNTGNTADLINDIPTNSHNKDNRQTEYIDRIQSSIERSTLIIQDIAPSEFRENNTEQEQINPDMHDEVNINNASNNPDKEVENNEDNSEDDLFLPSGNPVNKGSNSETNHNKKEFPKDVSLNTEEQIKKQLINSANKETMLTQDVNNFDESLSERQEFPIDEAEIRIEMDNTRNTDNTRSEIENINNTYSTNYTENESTNYTENCDSDNTRVANDRNVGTSCVSKELDKQPNCGENTHSFVETHPKDRSTNDIIPVNYINPALVSSLTETTNNLKFDRNMNVKIKSELNAHNDRDTENGCVNNQVQIKIEPRDVTEYNEVGDLSVINNDKNCIIC